MITPFERRPKDGSASATRKTAEGTAASANHACNPEGVVLPWLRTMPLPNEGMSIGIRPNEMKTTSTGHIGAEAADRPFSTENGNGRSCPVPEELSDHSNGLAYEADERHLPRAAQLALVLKATEDLARLPPVVLESRAILPVSVVAKIDRFATGVYGPEPQELAIPERARGSKKVQRGIFLVATVFTALALCIWTIGSSTSPDSTYEPQVASSGANLSAPFPPSSSGQPSVLTPTQAVEKSSGQTGQLSQLFASVQPQSSSETETPPTAESSANLVPRMLTGTSSPIGREHKIPSQEPQSGASSENAVISRSVEGLELGGSSESQALPMTPQASAAPAHIPSTNVASRRLDPEEIKLFVTRGEQLMATGDIVAARIVLRRAAESGDATAALTLGAAYDPNELAQLGVVGISADLEKARTWYHKAESLGSADARRRLALLDR